MVQTDIYVYGFLTDIAKIAFSFLTTKMIGLIASSYRNYGINLKMQSVIHLDLKTYRSLIDVSNWATLLAFFIMIASTGLSTLISLGAIQSTQLLRYETVVNYTIDTSQLWLVPTKLDRYNYGLTAGTYSSLTQLLCNVRGGCISGQDNTNVIITNAAIMGARSNITLTQLGYIEGYNTTNIATVTAFRSKSALSNYNEYNMTMSASADCSTVLYLGSQAWFKKLGNSQGTDTFPTTNMLPTNVICKTGHNLSNTTSAFVVHDLLNYNISEIGSGSLSFVTSGTYWNYLGYSNATEIINEMNDTNIMTLAILVTQNATGTGTFIQSRVYDNGVVTCLWSNIESAGRQANLLSCATYTFLATDVTTIRHGEICNDDNYSKLIGPYVQGEYTYNCIVNHIPIVASDCSALYEVQHGMSYNNCLTDITNYKGIVDDVLMIQVTTDMMTINMSSPLTLDVIQVDYILELIAVFVSLYILLRYWLSYRTADKGLQAQPLIPLLISTTSNDDQCFTLKSKGKIDITSSKTAYHNSLTINGFEIVRADHIEADNLTKTMNDTPI